MGPTENYLDNRTNDRILRHYVNQANPEGYENLMLKYDDRNKKIKQWMMAANMYGYGKPEVYQMIVANLGQLLQRDYGVRPQDVGRVIEEAGVGFKNTSTIPATYRPSEEIFSQQAYQDIDPNGRLYNNRFYSGDLINQRQSLGLTGDGPSGYANDSGYSPSISMGDVVNGFTDYLMNGIKGITADIPYAIERKFP